MTPHGIEIDGRNLSYMMEGEGEPVVVLLGGHRTPMTSWDKVWPMLAAEGRVLAYDRPGTGASDAADAPQDGRAVLATLDTLLERLDIRGPVVLVAHSLGGLYANLFARTRPERVAGMVLVDAAHPEEAEPLPVAGDIVRRMLRRLTGRGFMDDPHSEFRGVPATVAQIGAAGAFPALPLRVVTGARRMPFVPDAAFRKHRHCQDRLVTLSPLGERIIAEKSGHMPQISEPELVARTVIALRDVCIRDRSGTARREF